MNFLWFLIIGGIAGWLGSLLFKGSGSGIIMNIILGILGGLFGGWVFGLFGIESAIGPFITAIIGAFLLQWIFSMLSRR
ncbi:MAG TPA: GlsB/YeaQ/YmgE family stress response membrane protein [Saprospiraceae bacterium]|nr:GlsB/YeaQ/YmgE family stress response membrane protein [Saprospiraceae bacterium]HQW56834.1 GlsB/YeaQ/YmgE family stress response membrane protein [Saprospiraceae bacterium]